jgi:hypothetical protein
MPPRVRSWQSRCGWRRRAAARAIAAAIDEDQAEASGLERRGLRVCCERYGPNSAVRTFVGLLCSDVAGNAPQQAEPGAKHCRIALGFGVTTGRYRTPGSLGAHHQFTKPSQKSNRSEWPATDGRAETTQKCAPTLRWGRRTIIASHSVPRRQHLTGAFANIVGMTSASRRASTSPDGRSKIRWDYRRA